MFRLATATWIQILLELASLDEKPLTSMKHLVNLESAPFFTESKDRNICSSEVGLGADVIIVGAYGGICLEEVADFIGGIFMLDFKKDDLE
jgi:hypothetical protein